MSRELNREEFLKLGVGAVAGTSSLLLGESMALARPQRNTNTKVIVDAQIEHQTMDGFGFSEAFQRANILRGSEGLSPENRRRVLDLLFSREKGAGFSILRNQIGGEDEDEFDLMKSIAPVSPGSPDAELEYSWDGSDNNQVWLSKEAQGYGVRQFYANAWSAPGYMKTNGNAANGGRLAGVPGASGGTGDWRQTYADYLVQYLRFYAEEGIPINYVGFLNEPDLTTSYESMRSTGTQAADFIKILGPTLESSSLHTKIACNDGGGWDESAERHQEILDDPEAAQYLSLVTGHGYRNPPNRPLDDNRHVWQTEWANFDPWNPRWDDGSDGAGLTWASNIHTALTRADTNAFFYWWGASSSTANSGLIRLQGDSYGVSKRLWAFANYSRFVRPGDTRVDTQSQSSQLEVTAFRGQGSDFAIQVLNTGSSATTASFDIRRAGIGGSVTPYITNSSNDLSRGSRIRARGNKFAARVPARTLVTFVSGQSL